MLKFIYATDGYGTAATSKEEFRISSSTGKSVGGKGSSCVQASSFTGIKSLLY